MKLLKICANGLPLLHSKCEIAFFAQQRVSEESAEKLSVLFANNTQTYYINNVLSFIGINASGKTTLLRLVTFVCKMLNNEALNSIDCLEFFDGMKDGDTATFETYFYANESVCRLHTAISKTDSKKTKFVITDEYLQAKPYSAVKSKVDLFNFDSAETMLTRNKDDAFLLDDVSIMVAYNKKSRDHLYLTDMLRYTNTNQLSISEDCPPELIAFFDPSVEYLHIKATGKDTDIRLKFLGKDELTLNKLSDVNRYLSSGTIKGINTFLNAVKLFETGGYLIVDELENHFNHEIVSTLIRFYWDKKVNKNGAVLLFSTHYAELLDEFDRNDSIYVIRNREGISAENLADILKRSDIKKSQAYESGFLDGTVPMYDAYMALKKSLIHSSKEGE